MSSTYTISHNILDLQLNVEIRQVYIWALSLDNKYVLVAKGNQKYHQPGGHPEKGESINQTIIREMYEETGIELTESDIKDIQFVGYYTVIEDNQTYLQLRFLLKLNKNSSEYNLAPHERDTEKEDDKIKYVNFFTMEEFFNVISWLKTDGAEEVKSIISNI